MIRVNYIFIIQANFIEKYFTSSSFLSLIYRYMWNIANRRANGKLVTIIDMKGLGFRQIISGSTKQLLQRQVKVGSQYYPERTYKTLIINVRCFYNFILSLFSINYYYLILFYYVLTSIENYIIFSLFLKGTIMV